MSDQAALISARSAALTEAADTAAQLGKAAKAANTLLRSLRPTSAKAIFYG